ncbi:MAG TPA: exopolysaccharide biosynthesis polyprenyl glycosylphosphotransferase [Cyclobacteriaceae bacterium]|nr:exopolysaccharide biosynthesis polyprenyl glycosylphosphotransferase [Cyclobacteriaceae bacterium]
MAKRFYKYFPWLFIFGDLLVIVFSLFISKKLVGQIIEVNQSNSFFYLTIVAVWLLVTVSRKDYKLGRTSSYIHTLQTLMGSLFWFLSIISFIWFLFHFQNYHLNRFLLLVSVSSLMLLILSLYRVAVHMAVKRYRMRGGNYSNAVVIGKGGVSQKLVNMFHFRKDFGIRFLGYYDERSSCDETRGDFNKFFEEADSMELDVIYLNENLGTATIRRFINFADEHYIKVKVIPSDALQLEKNLSFSKYGEFLVINVNHIPLDNAFNRIAKRAFDVIFSALVTVFILSWMIPLVGFLIKLESKGPVFFIQERNGENNRVFKCIKFRTMTPNDYSDTHQAKKNDPRVTRIGAFLRNFSLDEMPQFINVLLGEMSIVGPRPHPVPMNQVFKKLIEKYNSRHKIKPGITGLAQVMGYRGEIVRPFQIRSRVRLDYFYIQNWSFWLDITIVFNTLFKLVFDRENAY